MISVRPAAFDGSDAATQQILATLHAPAPARQAAVELVIRRQDNAVVSIVQPAGTGQPDFAPGEHVAIVEAAKPRYGHNRQPPRLMRRAHSAIANP